MTSAPPWAGCSELLDLLPDAVIALDAEQRIVAVNAATCRLTGYPPAELVGLDCQSAMAARRPDGRQVWPAGWHRSARLAAVRGIPEQDVTVRTAGGRDVRTTVTGSYQRNPDGRLTGAVLVLRDAGRRADDAVTGIEIVSSVSHELRSPLTSIKGYTSLLLERWDRLEEGQKRQMLAQVHHDAGRVTRLVTELLDISRLETGRLGLRRQMVDLGRLAAEVADKLRLEYPGLAPALSFPDRFPEVSADPDKIEQVLTNLVENACKYAAPTGISIVGRSAPGGVSVTVTDQGEGIPAADLPRVFTKFFRRLEGQPSGSGLGLWISRGLVELHGGRLVVESNPGQGTAFRFTLPFTDQEEHHGP